ncbi:MarR family winged helix-turn-helix transcriptional regulator [Kitasatospora viridis]|uniref:DNA-binding MarR family transcriptional regulator n=1 Tax=Kitasatospora viridis TaxID=281105 RepID=A0A561UH57_9ACTN|nr:helix-turn-helix domain-containing protein [Kitasatospora viridis]TWF98700.1 DNA-binding MarR family transcriptional regulator [Kitasatospora viridis]
MHRSSLAHDADDCLFDPAVRAVMAEFTLSDETLHLEAASAVCAARRAVEWLRLRDTRGADLSSGALDILLRLNATTGEALPCTELARAAQVGESSVDALVGALEQAGLVERLPGTDGADCAVTRITAAGRNWLDSYRQPTQRAIAGLFHDFTPAELAQLRHLALRMVANRERMEHYLDLTEDALS